MNKKKFTRIFFQLAKQNICTSGLCIQLSIYINIELLCPKSAGVSAYTQARDSVEIISFFSNIVEWEKAKKKESKEKKTERTEMKKRKRKEGKEKSGLLRVGLEPTSNSPGELSKVHAPLTSRPPYPTHIVFGENNNCIKIRSEKTRRRTLGTRDNIAHIGTFI